MKIYVLDGYNVIHGIPELERYLNQSLEQARNALVRYCEAFAQERGDVQKVCIVFDGRDEYGDLPLYRSAKVEVVFSTEAEKADNKILELLENSKNRNFMIVSNDTYVFNNSRAYAAKVISVEAFNAEVTRKKEVKKKTGSETPLTQKLADEITAEYKRHLGFK
jgi:predicted RNA-binding protein with PIN domain